MSEGPESTQWLEQLFAQILTNNKRKFKVWRQATQECKAHKASRDDDDILTQSYALELRYHDTRPTRFIITGDRWYEDPKAIGRDSGTAALCPEFDLVFLRIDFGCDKFADDFDEVFATLPRWHATSFAVVYTGHNGDERNTGRVVSWAAWPFDCETGEGLINAMTCKPVAGREREVKQVEEGIRHFGLM